MFISRPKNPHIHCQLAPDLSEIATFIKRTSEVVFEQEALLDALGNSLPILHLYYGIACQNLGELELAKDFYRRASIDQNTNYYPINYLDQTDIYECNGIRMNINAELYNNIFKLGTLFKDTEERRAFHSEMYKNVSIDETFCQEIHHEAPYAKWVTGDISDRAVDCFKEFERRIRLKVDKLRDELTANDDHLFLSHIPQHYRIEFFGALLGPGGFHSPQVHSKAGLSGGYYAQVPELDTAKEEPNAGFIEFGRNFLGNPQNFRTKSRAI